MGDRSNLYFRNGDGGIGVYGHWTGIDMVEVAIAVLASPTFGKRRGDASYATRIGVQVALAALGASPDVETGFGLWTHAKGPDDNEHPVIVLDVNSGDCFVTAAWKAPPAADKIVEPTAASLHAAMRAP